MSFMHSSGLLAILACAALIAACSASDSDAITNTSDSTTNAPEEADAQRSRSVTVSERATPTGDSSVAGAAITQFGLDLFAEARSAEPATNLTVSPTSVAIALAMLEPGTVDAAQQQMRTILHIDNPGAFHASMNALEQDLEARSPGNFGDQDDPGEVTVEVANAAYLQDGYPFETEYLNTVGSNYGPVLRQVDFGTNPDDVAHEINDFVAEATNDQIVDLIADGVIKPETVLALVNAVYLKASWLETFNNAATTDASFTLLDSSEVDIALMKGSSSSSAAGDGWVAATKNYVGGLSAQFILPDEGRFDEIAANLPAVMADIEQNRTSGAELAVPRFETRTSTELTSTLKAMGLTAPYGSGGLLGIANDPRLAIDQVIHQAFVAMDEEGTEAAAATVVLVSATSGPASPPVAVILDRPFIYRIIDNTSGATLFIGQITNPSQ